MKHTILSISPFVIIFFLVILSQAGFHCVQIPIVMISICMIYSAYWAFFLWRARGIQKLLRRSVAISAVTLLFHFGQLFNVLGNRELEWMIEEGYMPHITPLAAIFTVPLTGYVIIFRSILAVTFVLLVWLATSIILLRKQNRVFEDSEAEGSKCG